MKLLRKPLTFLFGKWVQPKEYESYDEATFCRALGQKYENIHSLKDLTDATLASTETSKTHEVRFRGMQFGDSVNQARMVLGNPNYIYTSRRLPKYVILFYKERIGDGDEFWSELHFHDNTFVMGKYLIENFEENRIQWTNMLRKKYQVNQLPEHATIKDHNEHYISMHNGVFFEVCYMDLHYMSQFADAIYEMQTSRYEKKRHLEDSLFMEFA
jgi:hypothetical protein